MCDHIKALFGAELDPPEYIPERGEITMTYREPGRARLDLSCAGRGLQQTLLLLAHLYANPESVLLLDEPDAHLEILRQRQTYGLISDVARKQGSQVVAASHSEVLLNEAAKSDMVIAFVGEPHRVDDRGSQVLKALKDIPFEDYYQAEQTGWVLYLEGSTDLAILRALATALGHPAASDLEQPFVKYVVNQPQNARNHFYGLREANRVLLGVALYDRLDDELQAGPPLAEMMWQRRELENYICLPDVLIAYAEADQPDDLFGQAEAEKRKGLMQDCIEDLVPRVALRDANDRWWSDTKASDDFLDRLFEDYFQKLSLPNLMRKTNYHRLARLVPKDLIPDEVSQKLDAVHRTASQAKGQGTP